MDGAGCYHFCYHITSQNAPPVCRAGKRNVDALHLGADCLRPGTAGTVKPRYFLNRCSLLNTSSRTAGADLDSGHKIEPAQKKVVIASSLFSFLNHEAKALAAEESHDPLLAIA